MISWTDAYSGPPIPRPKKALYANKAAKNTLYSHKEPF